MNLMLDTHAFLWFVLGESRLSEKARRLIENESNRTYISPAVYWELAIKVSLGKFSLSESLSAFLDRGIGQNGFLILPIEPEHVSVIGALPFHHRDPFDRLLIAQAMVEEIPVVSEDRVFDQYPVERVW